MRGTGISLIVLLSACLGGDITGSARRQPADPLPIKSINIEGPATVEEGHWVTFTAVVLDMSNARIVTPVVDWSTSDPGVATINGSGQLQGIHSGAATITATMGGKESHGTVTVIPYVCSPGAWEC